MIERNMYYKNKLLIATLIFLAPAFVATIILIPFVAIIIILISAPCFVLYKFYMNMKIRYKEMMNEFQRNYN